MSSRGKCRMQNDECRTKNQTRDVALVFILHSALCDLRSRRKLAATSAASSAASTTAAASTVSAARAPATVSARAVAAVVAAAEGVAAFAVALFLRLLLMLRLRG